ncbi:preprotein translocase subunit YajC [Clostridium beijerinckii]|nr:preprotein translocase subunit YajC [Clostridium beijerinckii]NYC04713.1 preprotein translocase subunit YajC [Clostridium beijerinckii]
MKKIFMLIFIAMISIFLFYVQKVRMKKMQKLELVY